MIINSFATTAQFGLQYTAYFLHYRLVYCNCEKWQQNIQCMKV